MLQVLLQYPPGTFVKQVIPVPHDASERQASPSVEGVEPVLLPLVGRLFPPEVPDDPPDCGFEQAAARPSIEARRQGNRSRPIEVCMPAGSNSRASTM